jgi:hypothetical protein
MLGIDQSSRDAQSGLTLLRCEFPPRRVSPSKTLSLSARLNPQKIAQPVLPNRNSLWQIGTSLVSARPELAIRIESTKIKQRFPAAPLEGTAENRLRCAALCAQVRCAAPL